ncbi:hypothetical protein IKE72_02155 [Candidatus Saccharibacteria bacterium]|nr:hypothetical protein [Candidatus Saccharibacteria bacterium]
MKKTKKGAASFYIVTITTLILMVLVVSFATVITSEIERTTNDDLSQSAYDTALAGVEDARIAFAAYQKCKAVGGTTASGSSCNDLIRIVEADEKKCTMVAELLGKPTTDGAVMIEEVNSSKAGATNNMQQYYTCNKLDTVLNDYRATLSSSTQMKVIKAKFANGITANMIGKLRVSWYSGNKDTYTMQGNKLTGNFISNRVKFPTIGSQRAATPPTVSFALVQTAPYFNYGDFDATSADGRTNRAMVYLVPSSDVNTSGVSGNYRAAWNGNENVIPAAELAKSNNKQAGNLPYVVKCGNSDSEFACSTMIYLPDPIISGGDPANSTRNDDTFLIMLSLPYGIPETDFSLEFFCKDGDAYCANVSSRQGLDGGQVKLDGIQVEIDSTGRANDIYRRVITRMESSADSSFLSVMGPLELYGSPDSGASKEALVKKFFVSK